VIGTTEEDAYSVRAEAHGNSFGAAHWPPLVAPGSRGGRIILCEAWQRALWPAPTRSEPAGSRQVSPPQRRQSLAKTGSKIGGARKKFLS
jgi:hypothetical protein